MSSFTGVCLREIQFGDNVRALPATKKTACNNELPALSGRPLNLVRLTRCYDFFFYQVLLTQLNLSMAFANSTAPVKDGLHPFSGGKNFG